MSTPSPDPIPSTHSLSSTDPTETDATDTMDTETARRIESDKLTRRAALRKLGFGAGMAAFSLLGVDDFARMVGKRLERMAGDNKTANAIAKEFQQAGIALAGPSGYPNLPGNCDPNATGATKDQCCDGDTVGKWCRGYGNRDQCKTCCGGTYRNFCAGYGPSDAAICSSNCDQDFK